MTFNDFVHNYNLKKQATSKIKMNEVLKKVGLGSKVGIYLRDGIFSTNCGIVNLHPSRGTHWCCILEIVILIRTAVPHQKNILNF